MHSCSADLSLDFDFIDSLFQKGYVVFEQVLPMEFLQNIQAELTARIEMGAFRDAKVGFGLEKQRQPEIRSDQVSWLEDPWPDSLICFYELVEGLRLSLNQCGFMGLFRYEGHLTVYPPGSFYRKHLDQFRRAQHRKVSCILYLNDAWSDQDGGELVLYDAQGQLLETIQPQLGRMILFFSDRIPHEVKPTYRERRSLTGWFCSRD